MPEQEPVFNKAEVEASWHEKIVYRSERIITIGDLFELAYDVNHLETGEDPNSQPGKPFETRYVLPVIGFCYGVGFQAYSPPEEKERPIIGGYKIGKATYTDSMGTTIEITRTIHSTVSEDNAILKDARGKHINWDGGTERCWAENIWRMYEQSHRQETP